MKDRLAIIPPIPPPMMHMAEATALFECCVMLFAWNVRIPGMVNWQKPIPVQEHESASIER